MVKKTIIPATKKLGKELIKEASPEHKPRVCAYVRVSTIISECVLMLLYAEIIIKLQLFLFYFAI